MTEKIKIGIIGGTGLYQMEALRDRHEVEVNTPFGDPSGPVILGTIAGEPVAFLARHGQGHIHNPSEVPYRANIWAMKSLGVEYIVAVSACGSLQEPYAPGHIVIPDQLIDFTKGKRDATFYENGVVAHVGVADPFCEEVRVLLTDAVAAAGGTVHGKGTYITIEGPRFSTRGESHLFRAWGVDIIGMTTSPEAFLAREAQICYAVMAMVTDYDVWHESEEAVTADAVIKTFSANLKLAQQAIVNIVPHLAALEGKTDAHRAVQGSIITNADVRNPAQWNKVKPLIEDA